KTAPALVSQESEHPPWPLQETGLKVNQPASFAVQLNGARGVIDARVHTPSGAVEECYVSEIDSDKHTIRFIPHENGVHSIDVKFNGAHIPGSPFKIRVGEQSQAGDPGLVSAYGPGLEGGTTGVSSEFIVNTLNAGSGPCLSPLMAPPRCSWTVGSVLRATWSLTLPWPLATTSLPSSMVAPAHRGQPLQGQGHW
ncbi:PREDICTED: filamin-B-like, partial [Rhinopithecus bieti]|uniref:filamin-B-like n=1 Tax=Rhinopithecus bieti TaxID=61621 RepID=UPI00083C635C